MKKFFLNKTDPRPSLEQGKIVSIDKVKGRVSIAMRNGLITAGSYLYDLNALREGMTVLVGRVSNSNVIIEKVSNIPRTSRPFSLIRPLFAPYETLQYNGVNGFCSYAGELYASTVGNSMYPPQYGAYKLVGNANAWTVSYTGWGGPIHEYGGNLYLGSNRAVYVFDGDSWTTSFIPDIETYYFTCFEEYSGVLYAGTQMGQIYAFDGASWTLSRQFAGYDNDNIRSLLSTAGYLVTGYGSASGLYGFNGAAWFPFPGNPYAGSSGSYSNGIEFDSVAYVIYTNPFRVRILTTAMTEVFNSTTFIPNCFVVHNSRLYMGGWTAEGVPQSKIYIYDTGSTWNLFYTGPSGENIISLVSFSGRLYAGTSVGRIFLCA